MVVDGTPLVLIIPINSARLERIKLLRELHTYASKGIVLYAGPRLINLITTRNEINYQARI